MSRAKKTNKTKQKTTSGMAAEHGGKRGFAVRCLALCDPVSELKLAALVPSPYK